MRCVEELVDEMFWFGMLEKDNNWFGVEMGVKGTKLRAQ
jgi:hypothetical protein